MSQQFHNILKLICQFKHELLKRDKVITGHLCKLQPVLSKAINFCASNTLETPRNNDQPPTNLLNTNPSWWDPQTNPQPSTIDQPTITHYLAQISMEQEGDFKRHSKKGDAYYLKYPSTLIWKNQPCRLDIYPKHFPTS